MTLLEEIERGATEHSVSLADLLRKCKVLAKRLQHAPLAEWAERELNGYKAGDELPDYRQRRHAEVRGDFSGPFQSTIRNLPIPTSSVEKEDRELFTMKFVEGVAHYEAMLDGEEKTFSAPWPADFVAMYQTDLVDGHVLVRAWRTITRGTVEGMLDQVRNRILSFALEIDEANPTAGERQTSKEPPIEPSKVEQIFNTYILGGTNVVATGPHAVVKDFSQSAMDWPALERALGDLGLGAGDIATLREAIDDDSGTEEAPGPAVQSWLGGVTARVAMGTLSLANSAAGSMVGTVVIRYLQSL